MLRPARASAQPPPPPPQAHIPDENTTQPVEAQDEAGPVLAMMTGTMSLALGICSGAAGLVAQDLKALIVSGIALGTAAVAGAVFRRGGGLGAPLNEESPDDILRDPVFSLVAETEETNRNLIKGFDYHSQPAILYVGDKTSPEALALAQEIISRGLNAVVRNASEAPPE